MKRVENFFKASINYIAAKRLFILLHRKREREREKTYDKCSSNQSNESTFRVLATTTTIVTKKPSDSAFECFTSKMSGFLVANAVSKYS